MTRLSATFVFLTIHLLGFAQKGQIIGHVTSTDSLTNINYLRLLIKINDSTIAETIPQQNGEFNLKNIPFGQYQLVITQIGNRDRLMSNVNILGDTTIDIIYPPPCNFIKRGQQPICVGGHTDFIIPIVYGLPAKKTMDKAKKGLIHLGGCVVSDCDPSFYCTIHHKEL